MTMPIAEAGARPRDAVVVGASGLVGSSLARRFAERGWRVTATVRTPASALWAADALADATVVNVADVLDTSVLESLLVATQAAVVVNCTGVLVGAADAIRPLVDANIASVGVLLAACSAANVRRVIVIGSGFEYAPSARPVGERAEIGPTTIYGSTKVSASALALHLGRVFGIEVCVARPFSLYGPRERPTRFVPYLVTSALADRAIDISTGDQRRDYLFVDDLADGIERAAAFGSVLPPVLNFSGPAEHSLIDMANLVLEITGSRSDLRAGSRAPNPADRPVFLGDSQLSRTTLAWHPTHDLRTGLTKTVAWYSANRSQWDGHEA